MVNSSFSFVCSAGLIRCARAGGEGGLRCSASRRRWGCTRRGSAAYHVLLHGRERPRAHGRCGRRRTFGPAGRLWPRGWHGTRREKDAPKEQGMDLDATTAHHIPRRTALRRQAFCARRSGAAQRVAHVRAQRLKRVFARLCRFVGKGGARDPALVQRLNPGRRTALLLLLDAHVLPSVNRLHPCRGGGAAGRWGGSVLFGCSRRVRPRGPYVLC